MIIHPRVRGFFCLTAHPVGCAANVQEQIDYVKSRGPIPDGPKRVLVIGASTSYGLGSRISVAYGFGAATLGVFLEKPPSEKRTATAGWYNSAAFEKRARADGLYARSINGDAYSDEVKQQVVDRIRADLGTVDLVVYSLASPRRTDPETGVTHTSVLKPIGAPYHGRTLDTDRVEVKDVSLDAATEEEIEATVKVMGGEDWLRWIDALEEAGVLAPGCRTVAYSYIGSEITWAIYRKGTIGMAKEDLHRTAKALDARLGKRGGGANVAILKAVVTQSSSAIPVVPLYISLLYRIMKEKGDHEGAIEQTHRLFSRRLFVEDGPVTDPEGLIRLDDWEMKPETQEEVADLWGRVTTGNLRELADFEGYRTEFLRLFGFEMEGVDYDQEVDPVVEFPG